MSESSKARRRIHPLRDAIIAGVCTFVTAAIGLLSVYMRARDAQLTSVRS